jgi:diguanylate cyclase (GGDEF)-like protein
LILPDAVLESVQQRAEDIRECVKNMRIAYQNKSLNITVSLGVAVLPEHGPTIDDALKAVDKALYQAKADGRDRVVVASAYPSNSR